MCEKCIEHGAKAAERAYTGSFGSQIGYPDWKDVAFTVLRECRLSECPKAVEKAGKWADEHIEDIELQTDDLLGILRAAENAMIGKEKGK